MSRALVILAVGCAAVLTGCSNPDISGPSTARVLTGSPGEPPAPPAPSGSSQAPSGVHPTPQKALAEFARAYVNWDYRTLASDQRTLAAVSVGAARLSERQAAAQTGRDTTLARARVWNHGTVLMVAPDAAARGVWVIVTRERTGGSSEYVGLPAGYHVTLATVEKVPGGWAVSRWEPQS